MTHIPIRQCVVCRQKKEKRSLIRMVKTDDSGIKVDHKQILSGKGAYVCSAPGCLEKFRNGNYAENLWHVKPQPEFYTSLAKLCRNDPVRELQGLLGFAIRAGHGIPGMTAIERNIKKKKVYLIILDVKTGESTQRKINRLSSQHQIPLLRYSGERPLEDVVGKTNCKSLGIIDKQFARSIQNLI